MWDVIWTDPDRELLGEHRAKKEKSDSRKGRNKTKSGRSSMSTTSSQSSTDSPFSIFRSRELRKISSNSASSAKITSSGSSGLASPSFNSTRSPLSQSFDGESCRNCEGGPRSPGRRDRHFEMERYALDGIGNTEQSMENVKSLSLRAVANQATSNLNKGIEESTISELEKLNHLIQFFGQASLITKAGDACSPSKNRVLTPEEQGEVRDDGANSEEITDPWTPPVSPLKINFSRPSPSENIMSLGSPIALVPPAKSPLRSPISELTVPVMPNDPASWRPPNQWEEVLSNSTKGLKAKTGEDSIGSPISGTEGVDAPRVLDSMQQAVLRMTTISTSSTLDRLNALWAGGANSSRLDLQGSGDKLEKRLWMLSILHHPDEAPGWGVLRQPAGTKLSTLTAPMVLALHESPTTTMFLAALNPTKQLYHLTTTTTNTKKGLGNIRTLQVSSISPDIFPVAPRVYEAVYSHLLPSLFTLDALPDMTKNIAKCLKPGGTFRLTLIDPLPRTSTLGRRMRAWLEEHLLRNLAKLSRCMSPSTLFADLLGHAGLRGNGSTLTATKFYAIQESARTRDKDPDRAIEKLLVEKETKAQVRSLVGRTFWMEVWGPFVTTDQWWWEDSACVEECLQLGTFWEYSVINAVKGS